MSEKVYSYVVIGMITGEHYVEDLRLRVPYRTPVPITEVDFLNSKDLNRAAQQNLVKVVAQASIPGPMPSGHSPGLERKVEQLTAQLAESEKSRQELASQIETQGSQLSEILAAIKSIPAQTVVVHGSSSATNGNGHKKSEVVGGDVPMFIPDHTPIGTDARINMVESEGKADVGEAAKKLRELRKSQGGG